MYILDDYDMALIIIGSLIVMARMEIHYVK